VHVVDGCSKGHHAEDTSREVTFTTLTIAVVRVTDDMSLLDRLAAEGRAAQDRAPAC